jgi:hypothetical protein
MSVDRLYEAAPPPRVARLGLIESLRRHFLVALLPVVVFAAAAVALGLHRSPTYTSEARVNVGGLNLTQQTLPGYTTAVQQLAVAYARSIDAAGIVTPVARQVGETPAQVAGSLSATPVQGSPVITIQATGASAAQAQRIADLGTDGLIAYALTLNRGDDVAGSLLGRYEQASTGFRKAEAALGNAKGARARNVAETRVDTARLKMQTLGYLYQQSQVGQANGQLVQKLAPADPATSDRRKVLKDYLAAALIAGLLAGAGLAVARGNAVARRRLGAR